MYLNVHYRMYCDGAGNSDPTGECYEGWYCTGASDTPTPADGSNVGGQCTPGYYCPLGSVQMVCTLMPSL